MLSIQVQLQDYKDVLTGGPYPLKMLFLPLVSLPSQLPMVPKTFPMPVHDCLWTCRKCRNTMQQCTSLSWFWYCVVYFALLLYVLVNVTGLDSMRLALQNSDLKSGVGKKEMGLL